MSKDDLMMKAVIQLNGEMARDCGNLIYATSSNPVHPADFIGHWATNSKSDFLGYMDGRDTWKWLCTRDEFYQFIDELIEGCIKWDDTEWNGEGLPSVGVECDIQIVSTEYKKCKITYVGRGIYCYRYRGKEYAGNAYVSTFRLIKTEAEKERDELIKTGMSLVARAMNSSSYEQDWDQHRRTIAALVDSGWKCDTSQNGESDV